MASAPSGCSDRRQVIEGHALAIGGPQDRLHGERSRQCAGGARRKEPPPWRRLPQNDRIWRPSDRQSSQVPHPIPEPATTSFASSSPVVFASCVWSSGPLLEIAPRSARALRVAGPIAASTRRRCNPGGFVQATETNARAALRACGLHPGRRTRLTRDAPAAFRLCR